MKRTRRMIKPYYETDLGKLYHGDCLEILPQLTEKVDLVLTDPPYGINYTEWDFIDFDSLINKLVDNSMKLLKEGSLGFIWFPKKYLYTLSKVSFQYDIFIQTKNFAQKRATDIGIDCWVPVLMIRNGKYERKNNREGFKNWFMVNSANTSKKNKNNPRNVEHPTVKDVKVMEYIINRSTKLEHLVLDPFLGSGTTAVACERLGRRWIGIEISKEYCDIAVKRIKCEQDSLGVFT